jgi:adenine deaminase
VAGRGHLIAVARGDAAPDLVVEGARVFSAFTREWLAGDVAVADGRIAGIWRYDGGERVDGRGRFLVPGFVDAHMHIESSKLVPAEFARAVLPLGTTTVVTDPHEVANVLGAAGVRWMLEATEGLPLRVLVMAPSCVPASALESPREALTAADMADILRHPRALGVAEMMDFPAVVAGDEAALERIAIPGASHVDGHAPGVLGAALDAYAAAGIGSDHESTSAEEALEKRRRGMWVLIREASNARNLVAGLQVVRRFGPEWCAFCTDDREPGTLAGEGHVDAMCRAAVAEGFAAEDVLLMATLHPARAHRLTDTGAVAPGYRADLLLLGDLTSFRPEVVLAGGAIVARDGEALPFDAPAVPAHVRDTMHAAPVTAADLALDPPAGRVRAIEIVPGQLLTRAIGVDRSEPDLARLAVVERHHATGRVGRGLVRGFGLRDGAFASTVAHDAHNLVVAGTDEASMLACIARLGEIGGGVAVARDGEVRGELALPVAGLLSEEPLAAVAARMEAL